VSGDIALGVGIGLIFGVLIALGLWLT